MKYEDLMKFLKTDIARLSYVLNEMEGDDFIDEFRFSIAVLERDLEKIKMMI